MNKHINSFDNIHDYNVASESILFPAVSYIKTTKNVIYEFTTDKNVAQPGWVAYKENGIVTYYNPKSPELTSLTLSNIVGIVVVPTSHTQDGTVRIVSIDFMDYNNPTTGSNSPVGMKWGPNTDVTGITNVSSIVTYVTGTTTATLSSSCKMPTNYDLKSISGSSEWTISQSENDSRRQFISEYPSYPGASSKITRPGSPSPYNEDDTISSVYVSTGGSILSQGLCGVYNTDKMMAMVNHTGNIINSSNSGYYPAAECCRAYKNGSYYFPSIAELGYLVASFKEIDNVRESLGLPTLTGNYLWSSSCSGSNGAWYVRLTLDSNFGHCERNIKGSRNYQVLAFKSL